MKRKSKKWKWRKENKQMEQKEVGTLLARGRFVMGNYQESQGTQGERTDTSCRVSELQDEDMGGENRKDAFY